MEDYNILVDLIQLAPVVGVLVWVILFFRSELKDKSEEIKMLNDKLRENQLETINSVNRCTQVLGDLTLLIKEKIK